MLGEEGDDAELSEKPRDEADTELGDDSDDADNPNDEELLVPRLLGDEAEDPDTPSDDWDDPLLAEPPSEEVEDSGADDVLGDDGLDGDDEDAE